VCERPAQTVRPEQDSAAMSGMLQTLIQVAVGATPLVLGAS